MQQQQKTEIKDRMLINVAAAATSAKVQISGQQIL